MGTIDYKGRNVRATNVLGLNGVDISDWPILQPEVDTIHDNIMLNAFRIAINGGLSRLNMVDGVVDEFEDQAGVDTASSTDETYNAGGDYYTNNPGTYTADQVPTMTSNTAPSGTASASDQSNGEAYRAFADDGVSAQWASGVGTSQWLAYDWGGGNGKTITKIRLKIKSGQETSAPKDWTFEGWNGSGWDTLDTVTGQTGWTADTWREYTFSNSTSYEKYRINVTAVNGGGIVSIAEMEMQENTPPQEMVLIANTATAEAQPDEGHLVIFEEDVDAITVNTDLKGYISRDGGTTWTQVTLADEGDYETGKRILSGTVDISGQPSGTSMQWKITTHNNKDLRLHGVALEWK